MPTKALERRALEIRGIALKFLNYAVFMVILLLSNTVQTITGFAGNMIAMPFSIQVVDVSTAKCVLNVFSMAACMWIAIKHRKDIEWKILAKMVSVMLLGMVFASLTLEHLSLSYLLTAYGIMIIIIAVKKLTSKPESDIHKPSSLLSIAIIFCAGIIHELFVSGGALLVVYAVKALPNKEKFRATIACVWIAMDGCLIFEHMYEGYYTATNVELILLSVIPLVLSIIFGSWLYKKLNKQMFLKLTYILLLVAGVVALVP